jgi:hypothetical protein
VEWPPGVACSDSKSQCRLITLCRTWQSQEQQINMMPSCLKAFGRIPDLK